MDATLSHPLTLGCMTADALDGKLDYIAEQSGVSAAKTIVDAIRSVSAASDIAKQIEAEKNVAKVIGSFNFREMPEAAATLSRLGFFLCLGVRLTMFTCKVTSNSAEERVAVTDREGN
jgi:hypothetical protein